MATTTVAAPAKPGELLSERVAVVVYLLGVSTARRALASTGVGAGAGS